MRTLRFGIEIEVTGISRSKLGQAVALALGGTLHERNGAVTVLDPSGRVWNVVTDASLSGGFANSGEVVSPILTYDDIDRLQEVVRAVRRANGRVDESCSIHIHIDGSRFNAKSLANLVKMVHKNEQLLEHALRIPPARRARYCRPIDEEFMRRIETRRPTTLEQFNEAWYGCLTPSPARYHSSRYAALNLNSLFYRSTIEMRFFNGTLHAGEVKAYVQLVLAMAAKALSAKSASSKRRAFNPATAKYDFRVLLVGLGMVGPEFKSARLHLTKHLAGSSAWKGERRDRRSRPQAAEPSDPIASALAAA